jgi:periplasmic protein TonB
MAPSAVAEHLVKDEVIVLKTCEIMPMERERAPQKEDLRTIHPAFQFSQAVLLDENHFQNGSRTLRALASILVHVTVIATPILLGLFFTDTINIKQYASMMLVAPPPPPPPPPPASGPLIKAAAAHPRFITGGKLFAPTIIPKQVAEIKEEPIEPDSFAGLAGGVPGGVPGGQMGGVIGGVLGTAAPKPLPPMPGKSAPVRVGGRVRPPKAVVQIRPEYPPLARQARIQGQVQIDAVLDEQGNVMEMKVVSGPPLLYQSALDALKKWKYEPTYLNDQPIAVQMIVTITFVLGE